MPKHLSQTSAVCYTKPFTQAQLKAISCVKVIVIICTVVASGHIHSGLLMTLMAPTSMILSTVALMNHYCKCMPKPHLNDQLQ